MRVFEPFRLDTVNHCLWRGDERLPLTPKAFDVLRFLVDRAGRLVTADEILEAVWPDTYVNPEGVRKYIQEIRKVLQDRPDQAEFIQTFPKRGYQFVAKLTGEEAPPSAHLPNESDSPIVGRAAALERLQRHLETALTGHRQMIFVTGEPGIGKTTLVDVFQQHAARQPQVRLARGQCIEGFGGKEAYYPMLDALGSMLRRGDDQFLIETLAKRAPTWLAQFPSLLKPEQRELLQREILGSTRERMVREICEALEVITAQSPLVVILEDLHWVDPSTLDLISALARRREPARLILVATYRPVDVVLSQSPLKALKQDLLIRDLCQEIAVERLAETDVSEFLSKEFASHSFPSGLATLIQQNSCGNPLFMTAIIRDIVKKGLIVEEQGRWKLSAPLKEVYTGVPESLQQMLEIQFEQLGEEEQRILESCSVAGERFSVWAASLLAEMPPALIEEICGRLAQRRQFIRFAGIHEAAIEVDTAHYEFRHSLYRQALYRRLSGPTRLKLHRSLAEGLMPLCDAGKRELASELALHCEEARDYERAARYWIVTAENATGRFSHRDAIQILRRALELVPELASDTGLELEIQILQRIGDLLYAVGEMADSCAFYQTAVERAADAGRKAAEVAALLRLAVPSQYIDPARCNEIFAHALALSAQLDDPLLEAQTRLAAASFRLMCESWRQEDAEAAAAAHRTLHQLSGSVIPQDVFYLYVQAVQGRCQEALEQADALILATANPSLYVLAMGGKLLALLLQGRLGEVLHTLRGVTELAEKNDGDPWIHVLGELQLRWICFDFEGVQRLGGSLMRGRSEPQALRARTLTLLASGHAEIMRGNYLLALRCFEQVRDFQRTPRFLLHWYWRIWAEHGTAEALLSAGELAKARGAADRFLQSALRSSEPNIQAVAWEIHARVAAAENEPETARQSIAKALDVLERAEAPVAGWRVHRTAADLFSGQGDWETAAAHRSRAQELIRQLADSFPPDEPLRESLLSAAPVRRVLEQAVTA